MTNTDFQSKLINLQASLLRLAYRLTYNNEDAKDLVQETLLKALIYKESFRSDSNLNAWVNTILRNTHINNYRRSLCHNALIAQSSELKTGNMEHIYGSEEPDSIYTSKELERIIESLDDHLKLPFKMHHTGYKYKEIAEELELKIGTVKTRIFASRKKIKSQLNWH
ncbi:MAG: sigma-70 family RNA polymerase sigma factor [Bacteroidales bacterium]|nr:sigma-70 family RNA polymerase sigma factor [Bacteroidales bacterium]MBK7171948.1 sigma-70 family RNA polymerase sigma factor [Bacteroidales bacterium]